MRDRAEPSLGAAARFDGRRRVRALPRALARSTPPSGGAPLDRAAFFREEQRRKWDGVRRCC